MTFRNSDVCNRARAMYQTNGCGFEFRTLIVERTITIIIIDLAYFIRTHVYDYSRIWPFCHGQYSTNSAIISAHAISFVGTHLAHDAPCLLSSALVFSTSNYLLETNFIYFLLIVIFLWQLAKEMCPLIRVFHTLYSFRFVSLALFVLSFFWFRQLQRRKHERTIKQITDTYVRAHTCNSCICNAFNLKHSLHSLLNKFAISNTRTHSLFTPFSIRSYDSLTYRMPYHLQC